MFGQRVAAPLKTRLAMVRVVSVPYSIADFGDLGQQAGAAMRPARVGIDERLAPVQLLEDGRELGVAQMLVAIARV